MSLGDSGRPPAPAEPLIDLLTDLPTDLDWMALQAATLYRHDAQGRIVTFNEADGSEPPAPLFFLGRTAHGNLWRFRSDLPLALVRELARLAALEAADADGERDPERIAAFAERLEGFAGPLDVWRGPAFRFANESAPPSLASEASLAGPGDFAEFVQAFPGFAGHTERCVPIAVVRESGRIVAGSWCATGPGRAVECGVETLPEARGRGLAPAAVACWAAEIRRLGRIPLYSTSRENRASRAVARKLGLIQYGSDLHFRTPAPR